MSSYRIKTLCDVVLNQYRNKTDTEYYYWLKIGHDGYNKHGPESELYDLYIWNKTESKVYLYHMERWFNSDDDKKFYLLDTYKTDEIFKDAININD